MRGVIKLLKAGVMDGVTRLKSQLWAHRDTCDFILDEHGVLKSLRYGEHGFDFYEYTEPYEIVEDIQDMKQQL